MKNDPLQWVTKITKQIKDDFSCTRDSLEKMFNHVFVGEYSDYRCQHCGGHSTKELCKSCDF